MKNSLIMLLAATATTATLDINARIAKEVSHTADQIIRSTKEGKANHTSINARNNDFVKSCAENDFTLSRSVNFSGSNLSGSNFKGMNLQYANFNGTDLSNVNFEGANLSNADLRRANLSGADLRGADVSNAILDDAIGISTVIYNEDTKIAEEIIPLSTRTLKKVKKELANAKVTLTALKDDVKESLDSAAETIKDNVESATTTVKNGLVKTKDTVGNELAKAKKDLIALPENTKAFFKKTADKVNDFLN